MVRTVWTLWPPSLPVAPEWQVLSGLTVINPGRDRRENQTITMRGGRIESIDDPAPNLRILPRTRLFEHRYALPGLIDMDVRGLPGAGQLQRLFGVWFLAAGVTTVRDVGPVDGGFVALQERIAAAEIPWPRVIACGDTLAGDPQACPRGRLVSDPAAAQRAVDEVAAMGAPCVAVHWSLGGAALAAVRAAAARHGLPVVGDQPIGVALAGAALDDVRLTSAVSAPSSARRPSDWLRAWQGLDAAAIDALARSAAAQPTAYTPNLLRWAQLTPNDTLLEQRWLGDLLPRFYREVVWPDGLVELAGGDRRMTTEDVAAALANMRIAVRRLHEAGVAIHVGSATPSPYVVPGYGLWHEMMQLVSAGIPLEDVWTAATRGAGAALAIPQLGTLEPGAPADLLIFGKDPTREPDAITSLEAVVTRGRLYPKPLLNGYVLEHARYVRSAVYDGLAKLVPGPMMRWTGERHDGCQSP